MVVVVGASQSNTSHRSSALTSKRCLFGFVQTDSFGDFAKDSPVVGGLAGHQAWSRGDSATPGTFVIVNVLSDLTSAHGFCNLGFATP